MGLWLEITLKEKKMMLDEKMSKVAKGKKRERKKNKK